MFFGKLLPREGNFFELFNQHAAFIVEGARAFISMIENYSDLDARQKYADQVVSAEHSADKITAEVNRLLHKTFITPIDREQIHGLINAMDDIVDLLQDATETMQLYDVRAMTEEVLRLGDLSAKCCERVQHAVSLLPQLSRSDAAEAAIKTCAEIDKLESDADRVMRSERHYWATLNYIHHNPVHHGYVERWPDWPWSSASGFLEQLGRDEAEQIWLEYPIEDYGKGWDDPEM